jgi:hypothetical protein
LARRGAALAAFVLCLCVPAVARANGDPASDFLLTQNLFLPFTTKIDQGSVTQLNGLLKDAAAKKYRIRVAVILSPSDLGTAFSLFGKPQKYAEFLGLELSFVYRDRLVVVMPTGYGYAVKGDPDPARAQLLEKLPAPGRDATKEIQAATVAVQRLAAAAGHKLSVPKTKGSSGARDRITIAAAATAAIALIAAFVLYRRRRSEAPV